MKLNRLVLMALAVTAITSIALSAQLVSAKDLTLLSHQDSTKPATLPQTGGTSVGNSASNPVGVVGLLLAAALLLAGSRGFKLLQR